MDQYGRRRLHRFLLLEVRPFLNTTSANDQTIKCKQRGFYNHLSFKGRGPPGKCYKDQLKKYPLTLSRADAIKGLGDPQKVNFRYVQRNWWL